MRVLLAGASGEMGRHLIPLLVEAGHEVTGVTRRRGSLRGTGANEAVADVLDRAPFKAALLGQRFDAVINELTSLSKTPTRYRHMRATNRLRTEGTSALIAAARRSGATKFVTASIFLGYGLTDNGEQPIGERAAFADLTGDRIDEVLRALISNEQQVHAFGGIALRYGLFYGTRPVPFVCAGWAGTLPFVHVEDAAAATVLALDSGRRGAVYNIVDDVPASWSDVQRAAAVAAGTRAPVALPAWLIRLVAPYSAELITATSMRVSNASARRDLRWMPRYPSYHDGLQAAVRIGDLGST
jgi:nucleoside-diphosphate-sugar epimerase